VQQPPGTRAQVTARCQKMKFGRIQAETLQQLLIGAVAGFFNGDRRRENEFLLGAGALTNVLLRVNRTLVDLRDLPTMTLKRAQERFRGMIAGISHGAGSDLHIYARFRQTMPLLAAVQLQAMLEPTQEFVCLAKLVEVLSRDVALVV